MTRRTKIRLAIIVPLLIAFSVGAWVGVNMLVARQMGPVSLVGMDDADGLRWLARWGIDLSSPDADGQTLLHVASLQGSAESINTLVELGLSVDAVDKYGATPLIRAAAAGHVDVVRRLVDLGADVDFFSGGNGYPLTVAAKGGHADVLRILLEAGANTDVRDPTVEQTALHCAAWKSYPGAVKALIEGGAEVDSRCRKKRTPLHWAASCEPFRESDAPTVSQKAAVIRLLAESGANVNATSRDGTTPLVAAVLSSGLDSVRTLVDLGANVNAMDDYRRTALDYAKTDRLKKLLREHGAKTHKELKAEAEK